MNRNSSLRTKTCQVDKSDKIFIIVTTENLRKDILFTYVNEKEKFFLG